ncbi:MAG: helix-turn-helix domain-containing protein [Bacteroidota bacterium]
MEIELITLSDLKSLKREILEEIKTLIKSSQTNPEKKWLKSKEVQKLLGISPGTLQTLRNQGSIPFTRLGGVIYYERSEIDICLKENDPATNWDEKLKKLRI